ncbi:MAG: PilZ domain-containing protein [Bdellovibrionota bacterium]
MTNHQKETNNQQVPISYTHNGKKIKAFATEITKDHLLLISPHLFDPNESFWIELKYYNSSLLLFIRIDEILPNAFFSEVSTKNSFHALKASILESSDEYTDFVKQYEFVQLNEDKRKAPRYKLNIPVTYKNEEHFLSSYALDMSRGGMFITTDSTIQPGTVVELNVEIGSNKSITVKGKVSYSVSEDGTDKTGIGIQFLEFSNETQNLFNEFLSGLEWMRNKNYGTAMDHFPEMGTTKQFLVPELMFSIQKHHRTGILHLIHHHENDVEKIYFHAGYPIFLTSSNPQNNLVANLQEFDVINKDVKIPDHLKYPLHSIALIEHLLKSGQINDVQLLRHAISFYEEAIIRTFAHMDCNYHFEKMEELPSNVPRFPLRLNKIVFGGIEKTFEPCILNHWQNLTNEIWIGQTSFPTKTAHLPADVKSLLNFFQEPHTYGDFVDFTSKVSKTAPSVILFSLKLAGWLTQFDQYPMHLVSSSNDSLHASSVIKDQNYWIELAQKTLTQYEKANFYEILEASRGFNSLMLKQKAEKKEWEINHILGQIKSEQELCEQLHHIKPWIHLAHDVLASVILKRLYDRRLDWGLHLEAKDLKKIRQADRELMEGILYLYKQNISQALQCFEESRQTYSKDPWFVMYHAWSLFQFDRSNAENAMFELLECKDNGLEVPELYYFIGKIFVETSEIHKAKDYFTKALHLDPDLPLAKSALAQVIFH